jgi:hypothetical protein
MQLPRSRPALLAPTSAPKSYFFTTKKKNTVRHLARVRISYIATVSREYAKQRASHLVSVTRQKLCLLGQLDSDVSSKH